MTGYVDAVKSAKRSKTLLIYLLSILGGSLFLAVMAQCAIPLPFTPVPLTLQTFGVLMIGGVLGSKRGALTVLSYLIQGCMGLPVFAGGNAGMAIFMGPRFGYFLGFLLAAFVVGWIIERGNRRFSRVATAFFIGEFLILSSGTLGLSLFTGIKNALIMGFFPFIFCGLTKAILAALTLRGSWKIMPKL